MKYWNFAVNNDGEDELYIDGELMLDQDWWMPDGTVVARDFRAELAQKGDVTVKINSLGGSVFAGAEMYAALKEHKGKVTVVVTGMAASAASVVAMAGDVVKMHPTSYMMIHDPWTTVSGNATEMRKEAKVLTEIGEGIINAYALKTGKSHDEIARMMHDDGTTMSAAMAVQHGFADEVIGMEIADRAAACVRTDKMRAHDDIKDWLAHQPDPTEEPTPEEVSEELRDEVFREAMLIASLY